MIELRSMSPSDKTVPGQNLRSLGCRMSSSPSCLAMSAEAAAKPAAPWMWTDMLGTLHNLDQMCARHFQLGASSSDHLAT